MKSGAEILTSKPEQTVHTITPSAAFDQDVGLVNAPGTADRTRESIPTLLEFEHIALDPTKDRTRCDTDAALEHHGGEVAVGQLVGTYQRTHRMTTSWSKWRPLNIGWRQRRTMAISGVAGSRVYPDLKRHSSRKPVRCHRMRVSGRTTANEVHQPKSFDSRVRLTRVATSGRRGFTPRSTYIASCRRRNRFSAATIRVGRSATMANRSTSASSCKGPEED
jgi:hypothetical protein